MFKSSLDTGWQKGTKSGKSSYLQGIADGCIIIQEAFQYPTRLGRQGVRRAGRPLFMEKFRPVRLISNQHWGNLNTEASRSAFVHK